MTTLRTAGLAFFALVSMGAAADVMLTFDKHVSVNGGPFMDTVEVAESPVALVTWRYTTTLYWDVNDIVEDALLRMTDFDVDFTSESSVDAPHTIVTEIFLEGFIVPFTNTATATFTWYPCDDWETGGCEKQSTEQTDTASITVAQTVSQIAEPTTLALLGIGLAGLGFTRRRARRGVE